MTNRQRPYNQNRKAADERSCKDALKLIKDEEVEYVDIRFTDPKGKLQHVTLVADLVDEDFFEEGFMFDGSSIAGWKSIDQSDMKLIPDAASVYIDPFYAEKTMCVHCVVVEPDTGEAYSRCPRQTALKAEAYLKSSGIGDAAYFGPEAEFFLFDDVRYSVTPRKVAYEIDAEAAAWNTDTVTEGGNYGHRAGHKGGYFPVNPVDEAQDIRGEMLSTMKRMGIKVDKHHHEVATCQHELGHDLRRAGRTGRQHPEVQVRDPQRGPRLRQDRDLHAEAHEGRQRVGHARQHVDLEGRQAAVRRRQVCRPVARRRCISSAAS